MASVPQERASSESLAAEARPIVVKLGGSVVRSPELRPWLDAIAASPAPVVVVPGGGALADEVRSCQAALGFGDAAAHRMALLAMDQLAWAVAGLHQGFEVGDTEPELKRILASGTVSCSSLLKIRRWRRYVPYLVPLMFILLSIGLTYKLDVRHRAFVNSPRGMEFYQAVEENFGDLTLKDQEPREADSSGSR